MKNKNKVAKALANQSTQYAVRYNCSLIEAIADRDYPVSRTEVIETLKLLNIPTTDDNVAKCRPDDAESISAYLDEEYYRNQP